MLEATGAAPGDLVLIVADRADRVAVALDGLRRTMAARLELVREGEWQYLWVTEPPLFEWSDEDQRWAAQHHPFTAPLTEDLAPETAKARAYDIVLNGFELGVAASVSTAPTCSARYSRRWGSRPRRSTRSSGT